jgi:hypothetical protein
MTPYTTQRASFHEKGYSYPGTVVDRISFNAENETFHFKGNKAVKDEEIIKKGISILRIQKISNDQKL